MKNKTYTIPIEGKEVELNEYEVELVRFFANHYTEKGDIVAYEDFPKCKELGINQLIRLTDRLELFGLMESHSSSTAKIPSTVLGLVQQWDNPPLPDYRDKITKWFWSKPWSIPVLVVAVGIPIAIEWIKFVKFIIEWIKVNIR